MCASRRLFLERTWKLTFALRVLRERKTNTLCIRHGSRPAANLLKSRRFSARPTPASPRPSRHELAEKYPAKLRTARLLMSTAILRMHRRSMSMHHRTAMHSV
jgi:hypothetical protein